jgi:hypothetical protein
MQTAKTLVGGSDPLGQGGTVTIIEGQTLGLSATSSDKDTKTPASGAAREVADTPNVVWSCSAGNVSAARTASGASITFTPPAIPNGQATVSATVTAKPDDDTIAAPGNRPVGDTGNRNDDPGAGVTITIKVIKNCPTKATQSSTCTLDAYATYWAAGYRTWGFLTSQITVSGGTPPDPPKNWNGLFVREEVVLHPTTPGTAAAADFNGGATPAQFCTATVQGFIVGQSPGPISTCPRAAADDTFWDDHGSSSTASLLKVGKGPKTVICQQKYFCKDTLLGTLTITRSFQDKKWTPPAPPGAAAVDVTEVTITKN